MFLAVAAAIAIGLAVAGVTTSDARLRIADDASVAILLCVSGAMAGWALADTVTGRSTAGLGAWDTVGALFGAIAMASAAWRGRRRTFAELAFRPTVLERPSRPLK